MTGSPVTAGYSLVWFQSNSSYGDWTWRHYLYIMDTKTIRVARAYVAQVSDLPKEGNELDTGTPTMSTGSKATLRTWHQRLRHLHSEAILQMAHKGMVRGMEISGDHGETKICQACLDSKQTRTEIWKTMDTQADGVLGCMFSDVCGKLPTVSWQGYHYFVTFMDDHSRKVFITGLQEKSKVFQNFMKLLAQLELQMGAKLKAFRTNGRGEYTGKQFKSHLKARGIHHEIITPNTP